MLSERLISILAPSSCLVCGKKGVGLCENCANEQLSLTPSRCYRCHKSTLQHQVCPSCRSTVRLNNLWVVCAYEGLAKDLIYKLKFERAGYLAKDISRLLADCLPMLPSDTLVCHVPTAPKRIRIRGYDQSKLIAKELCKQKNLRNANIFSRVSNSRQLGASRQKRFDQVKMAYILKSSSLVKNKKIIIVDDVTTSGATLEFLAKTLKQAGAKSVSAVVFAQVLED